MKKSTASTTRAVPTKAVHKPRRDGLASLVAEVRSLIQSARRGAASVVNTLQVMTNFEIGRRIVQHEQKGETRAAYGKHRLRELSIRLTEEFGRGFSVSNLQFMRQFFLEFRSRIQQTPSVKLASTNISQTPSGELPGRISETPSRKSPFTLSWSHYVLLLTIKDADERRFYEIESTNEDWSLSELKRQKASALYERLAVSRDKAGVRRLAEKGQVVTNPEDVLKEPYVLEFLGLDEKAATPSRTSNPPSSARLSDSCSNSAKASCSSRASGASPSTKTTKRWPCGRAGSAAHDLPRRRHEPSRSCRGRADQRRAIGANLCPIGGCIPWLSG